MTPLDYVRTSVLLSGETIAWQGRPATTALTFAKLAPVRSVASVIPVIVIVVWISLVSSTFEAQDQAVHGIGILFMTFGFAMLVLTLWQAAMPFRMQHRAGRAHYVITDRRVLIVEPDASGFRVTSRGPDAVSGATFHDHGGTGHVMFRSERQSFWHRRDPGPKFTDGLWGLRDFPAASRALDAMAYGG